MYLRDVVAGSKQYHRYVEDFVNSHRYIDCNHAVCRNCHEMNIHIVKGLLNDCSNLIRSLFTEADFSFEKCMELHVAILFDTLLEHSFIQAKWQTVLSNGRFLQTKDGKGFVSASSLSSALSALRNNMTSAGYGIRRAIDELREW